MEHRGGRLVAQSGVNDPDGSADQAAETLRAFDRVTEGGRQFGRHPEQFQLGDGRTREAECGGAGIFDGDVAADLERVGVRADFGVGRMHPGAAVDGMAISWRKAGQGLAMAQFLDGLHSCSSKK